MNGLSAWIPALVVGLALTAIGCDSGKSGGESNNGTATNSTGGQEQPSGDTIKIGLVASQTGDLKPWGEDEEKGARLAVKEFNDAGGVDGKKVDLRVEDSNSDAKAGKSAAEKLISEGVIALVGEVASSITAQIREAAATKKIPVVAVGATRIDITTDESGKWRGGIWRVCYTDAFQGPVMARFAFENLGIKKVGLMTDKKQIYSTGLSNSFRREFERLGGKVVDEQFYESGQTQFGPQLTNLKSKNPEALFLSGYFTEVGQIARQAREAGMDKVKFFGGDGWDSRELVTYGGDAIIGGFYCNHYNNGEDRPEVKEFLSKFNAEYGSNPGTTMGALGYDAMKLVLEALKRAKTKDAAGLSEAIEDTVDFPGVSGKISLKGKHGDPEKRALVVEVTKDGDKFAKAFEWFKPE